MASWLRCLTVSCGAVNSWLRSSVVSRFMVVFVAYLPGYPPNENSPLNSAGILELQQIYFFARGHMTNGMTPNGLEG